jgi:hypothetical protein
MTARKPYPKHETAFLVIRDLDEPDPVTMTSKCYRGVFRTREEALSICEPGVDHQDTVVEFVVGQALAPVVQLPPGRIYDVPRKKPLGWRDRKLEKLLERQRKAAENPERGAGSLPSFWRENATVAR